MASISTENFNIGILRKNPRYIDAFGRKKSPTTILSHSSNQITIDVQKLMNSEEMKLIFFNNRAICVARLDKNPH